MEQSLFDNTKPDSDGQNLREQLRPLTECCPLQTKFAGNTRRSRRNVARMLAPQGQQINPLSQVTNEDCMALMKRYSDKFFDLAVVDPPYADTFNSEACIDNMARKGNYNLSSLNGNKPTEKYWTELFRISKNQIIWGANWYGKHFGVGGIVWDKDNTGNYSPCEYAYQSFSNHVYIFRYRWNGMLQQNMKDKEQRIHPTQKPIALYTWIFKNYASEGQHILDTHLGSGSSRIAAYKAGLGFTGCELDKEYFEAQEARFKKFILQGTLF